MNQQQREIAVLNHAAEKLFGFLWQASEVDKYLPHGKQSADFHRTGKNDVFLKIVYGKNGDVETPQDITAILNILRVCLMRREPDAQTCLSLQHALNQNITVRSYYGQGGYSVPILHGNIAVRRLAECAIDYLSTLAKISANGNENINFVGVCPQCDGIFKKKRIDQTYCTKECKFSAWAKEKGKKYFAEKAKRNRAAKKIQSAAKKNGRR